MYVVKRWERFDDFIVGEQTNDLFPYNSSHRLV